LIFCPLTSLILSAIFLEIYTVFLFYRNILDISCSGPVILERNRLEYGNFRNFKLFDYKYLRFYKFLMYTVISSIIVNAHCVQVKRRVFYEDPVHDSFVSTKFVQQCIQWQRLILKCKSHNNYTARIPRCSVISSFCHP
jgi:hypothetical protein